MEPCVHRTDVSEATTLTEFCPVCLISNVTACHSLMLPFQAIKMNEKDAEVRNACHCQVVLVFQYCLLSSTTTVVTGYETAIMHCSTITQNAKARIAFCRAAAAAEYCSSDEPAPDWLQPLFAASWTASLLAAASRLQRLTVSCF